MMRRGIMPFVCLWRLSVQEHGNEDDEDEEDEEEEKEEERKEEEREDEEEDEEIMHQGIISVPPMRRFLSTGAAWHLTLGF